MEETIYVIARFKIKAEYLENALGFLKIAIEKTRQEEGNIQYDMHQDAVESNLIFFYERFRDAAAFDFHNKSSHIVDLVRDIFPILEEPLQVNRMRKF